MAGVVRPILRALEVIPIGTEKDLAFALRDPDGFGETVVVPYAAAILATLMNGQRTLAEIQVAFKRQIGAQVALTDLQRLVADLEEAYLLDSPRFAAYRQKQIDDYLRSPVRPAAHAGSSYANDPAVLRAELDALFTAKGGPGPIDPAAQPDGRQLCAAVSPHIDLHRGGVTFAWAYRRIVEQSEADLFVIFGTAHGPMRQLFSVCRKDFDTPLGVVQTDQGFIDRLSKHLDSSLAGQQIDLFEDQLAHRHEHSIEFQAMFLQYVLGGKRDFRIVPILVGSFQPFMEESSEPDDSPEFISLVAALRSAAQEHSGRVCYISGADLAHIGIRFGDEEPLDEARLTEQSADDRQLLEAVCRGDAAALFRHVADNGDRNRICGLAPTYTLLQVVEPARGELLRYDQAVEPDGSSCVSFASVALYRAK
jgi:AmmeMemoRadiSam system protein B